MAPKAEELIQACEDAVAAHDAGRWSNSRDSISWHFLFVALNSYEKSDAIFDDSRKMCELRSAVGDMLNHRDVCLIPGQSIIVESLRGGDCSCERTIITEQLSILTMSAFIAFLVTLCCYLLSRASGIVTSIDLMRNSVQWNEHVFREILSTTRQSCETMFVMADAVGRLDRKPRYRVANAIVKLPRKRNSADDNGSEVNHGT